MKTPPDVAPSAVASEGAPLYSHAYTMTSQLHH